MARSARSLAVAFLVGLVLAAGRCYDKDDYSPTAPPTQQALTLTTSTGQTTLPADGISRLRILAQIPPDADPDKRTVVFATSLGTLIGGTANADGAREATADVGGQATVELQSGQQLGDAVVTASIKNVAGVTRRLVISFVAANPDEVVRFVAAPATAPADGATISSFTVQLSPALSLGTPVQFKTTAGKFQPGDVDTIPIPANGSYTATADLKSASTLGPARITATVQNVSREVVMEFRRALPDRIVVSTNNVFQVTPSTTAGVTVIGDLQRDIGRVTAGTVATFRATTEAGAAIGFFRDVAVVGSDGKATATFVTGETTYRGRVTLTVGAEGSSVTGSAEIEVVDP